MKQDPKIVIYGAGAIGGSAGAWIAKEYKNVYLIARGVHSEAIRNNGLVTIQINRPESRETIPVEVLGSISEAPDADVVVIAVKNFSLEAAAIDIKNTLGDRPLVVGMQNGLANQTILPKYFSKVVYCVIGYNAWIEEPGVIGYHNKGPLILGTPDNSMADEMRTLAEIFNPMVPTEVSGRFMDAAHTKLVMNLSNAYTTLIGFHFADIPDTKLPLVYKLFTRQLLEGVRVVKAAGYKQVKIPGMIGWGVLSMLSKLPGFITNKLFAAYSGSFYASSMAQDVIQRKSGNSELEYLSGYLLSLAQKYHVNAPVNRAVYDLCNEAFARPEFTPVDAAVIWEKAYGKK